MWTSAQKTLPPGYLAQPVHHQERHGSCYEFSRVYAPNGRLVPGMSYWSIVHQDEKIRAWHVTYDEYCAARGRRAAPFSSFASALFDVKELERVVAETRPGERQETSLPGSRPVHA